MRLTELNPRWVGAGGEGVFSPTGRPCPTCPPDRLDPDCRTCFGRGAEFVPATERSGVAIMFDCPCQTCTLKRTGNEDKDFHLRHCITVNPPLDGGAPFEHCWTRRGDTFETLQLSPSILSDPAKGGCGWHGYIGLNVPGEVTTC